MKSTELFNFQKTPKLIGKWQQMEINKWEELIDLLIKLFEAKGMTTGAFLRENPNINLSRNGLNKILNRESVPSVENYHAILTALQAKISIDADLKLLLENKEEEEGDKRKQ